jgi:hypothetical protein
MTGYRKNRSKIGLNLNFKFEKQKTGIPVSITGKSILKPVNRLAHRWSKKTIK